MRWLVFCLALCALATPSARQTPADLVIEKNVEARMRDGAVLRADVYRPAAPGRRPALLQRTPYSKNPGTADSQFHRLARAGFVVVVQDTRGRYMSDGVAVPHDEGEDGYDTVEWVAQLPYVDGRVGMFGGSYSATVQLLAAPLQPPHLVALFPSASYASRYDMVFQGGAFYLGDGLSWSLGQAKDVRRRMLEPAANRDGELGLTPAERTRLRGEWYRHLPLNTIEALQLRRYSPGYFELLQHPSYDAFWTTFDVAAKHPRFEVPAYHLTGWYDSLLNGTLANFSGLRANAGTERARRNQRLIVGPWTHARPTAATTKIGDVDFGPEAGFDSEALIVRWFRHWMPSEGQSLFKPASEDTALPGVGTVPDWPGAPVRLFLMGENRWRDEQEWPLRRAQLTQFFLHSTRGARGLAGDGRLDRTPPGSAAEAPDSFTYDPADPVPTGLFGAYSRMPVDRREIQQRPDVLVYTSDPLTAPLEVTGPITAVLYIASSAKDTDFTAAVSDVPPDGTARALTDGIIRARYRRSKTSPELLTPGARYEVRIDVGATGNVFLPGHRIRLEVSSSNFPRYDRNPNTGAPFATDATIVQARQTVFHERDAASHLILPVIPR
ncbi:MAG: CocE/NonD family hydrolase [Acidobacteria bacterium]|nr:CocE/NonD family hydrolase [Acidobacteriota bacterium]